MTSRALPTGIRIKNGKYQAYVRVHGALKAKTFPLDTKLQTIHHWREDARVSLRKGTYEVVTGQTLAQDARRYLGLIESLVSLADRTYHVNQWVAVFGHRIRASLTPVEIRQQLERWRATGSASGGPLSPATLNLRRTALLALYTTLDGKHLPNPVKAVPPYREVERPLDLPTHDEAQRAIAAIWPAKYRPDVPPLSQARLWVLYWTGWPSSTLARVTARDIRSDECAVLLHGRAKGSGTAPRLVPVSPQAMAALEHLDELGGLGAFDGSSLNHTLRLGCRKAKVTPFRVYALRHLFGTTLAMHSSDLRGVAELMGHADPRQTLRYTRHAASERARSTLADAAAGFPAGQLGATSNGHSRARVGTKRRPKRARKRVR
jgi:integrase